MDDQALAYDLQTAARHLGIGRTKVYYEIEAGRIRSVKVGKRRLITRQALEDYVALLELESESVLVGSALAR